MTNKGKHWKIKDTSNMGHRAWNKGLKGFMKGRKFSKSHKKKIAKALRGNKNGVREVKLSLEEKRCRGKESELRHKIDVIAYYSNGSMDCQCCGESDIKKLSIDHINGNGNQHRTSIFGYNRGGVGFCLWLKRNGFPEGFQILCGSCNKSKGTGLFCRKHNK